MQFIAGSGKPSRSGRKGTYHILMKIDNPVLIRIIGVGLNPMHIPGKKHDILDRLSNNGIDNHLPFSSKAGAAWLISPSIVAQTNFLNRQWNGSCDDFPRCRRRMKSIEQPFQLRLPQHRFEWAVSVLVPAAILSGIQYKQFEIRPISNAPIHAMEILFWRCDRPVFA